MLRDFPEDGLKVSVVETGTLPLRFLEQYLELGELNVRSHVNAKSNLIYNFYFLCSVCVIRLTVDKAGHPFGFLNVFLFLEYFTL